MLIRYGYDITVTCTQPTPMVCLLEIRNDRDADIRSPEQVVTNPTVPTTTYSDLFGNTCRRFVAPSGDFSIWGDGTVEDSGLVDPIDWSAGEIAIAELPDECLVYLLGSRYCETDRLSQIAWDMFGELDPGWNRVQAICNFVNQHITFGYHNARSTRTAFEAYQERIGVCRDYAHLAIALIRCMNIPARYINGYLGDIGVPILDPMDFSAWIEVYIGGRWMTFDPRNNIPRIGRIVVARGRDAADVPLIHSFGPHVLKSFRVWTYDVTDMPSPASFPDERPIAPQ
ncbi:transglutaminase-like domain-containing protein [Rhizobium tubonense]|uniref:Transglutaminase n=1 Tax=Rhizobium tubonense TaxID=484088 RepID=A0A2W4CIA1_9HYPH|nr:transglutaminase family protein [Rhizobium tubonense]PZM10345.1 transglutaminase [Rhizobium tubonense]